MDIEQFMQGYKKAWQERDEAQFCALFAEDGEYHNTPFAVQRGHAQLAAYWQRVKLQEDVQVRYEILATSPAGGIAHWHVTYQVASEELFRIWAQSTGTNLVARKPGEPLPRMVLDGVLKAEFDGDLCRAVLHREVTLGADLAAHLGQTGRVGDRLVGRVDVPHPAVVPGRAAEGDLREPAHQDRDGLGRRRLHDEPRRGVELALELGPPRLPELRHQRERLVGPPTAGAEVLAEELELLAAPADPDTEGDPVAREHRGGAHALRDLEGAADGGDVDRREEPQPGGDGGQRPDQDPGVGPGGVVRPSAAAVGGVGVRRRELLQVDDVVGHRHRVVAELVGRPGEHGQVVDRLEGGADREAHLPSLPRTRTCSRESHPKGWASRGAPGGYPCCGGGTPVTHAAPAPAAGLRPGAEGQLCGACPVRRYLKML